MYLKRSLWKWLLMLVWAMCPLAVWGQTVSGTVSDVQTGETLIGATVLEKGSGKGTVTDAYGRYTLTPGVAKTRVRVSYMGYSPQEFDVNLNGNAVLNVQLQPSIDLKEVNITADHLNSPKVSRMSAVEIPVEQIKLVPVIFGEADILKAIQLLPGVQSGGEGSSGIYVRGGGPDENLFLLDGVPLYNVNHLGGFFSAFNSNAVKNVTLYKGSFPARFSGRISSVLDITTNNGNDKEWHGNASVGMVAANVSVEGPIVREKTTLSASFRRTYLDLLMQPFIMATSASASGAVSNAGYYFYDLNAKLTHKFSDRSRLFASFYSGDDAAYLRVKDKSYDDDGWYTEYMKLRYRWGNIAATLRWNYALSPRLFMNATASYTRYRNRLSLGIEESMSGGPSSESEASFNSGIQDFTLKTDFNYSPVPEHSMRFGASVVHHLFTPEVLKFKMDELDMDTVVGESRVHAEEVTLYFEDDWTLTDALKINAGVVVAGFGVEGKFYPSVQPRLCGRLMLTDDLSLKAGYAYMTQYMHLLSTSNISLPSDLWVPVTKRIPPMGSHQVALGVFYTRWGIDFSVEGYYKWMHNLMEYLPGSTLFGSSTGWENKVCLGDGRAYGIELLAQKTMGNFTGWLGYTLSRTLRTFDRLNNGREFPAKYDRIHDISLTVQYKPNDNFDCGVTWVFSTGNTATLALQEFDNTEEPGQSQYQVYTDGYGYVESRNNFRMPNYHRMDVSFNFHKKKRHGIRTWNISIYNLYNHRNPYLVYRGETIAIYPDITSTRKTLKQVSLFPIIPSVSYIYKF